MKYAHKVPRKDLDQEDRRVRREVGRRSARKIAAIKKHEALVPSHLNPDRPRKVK